MTKRLPTSIVPMSKSSRVEQSDLLQPETHKRNRQATTTLKKTKSWLPVIRSSREVELASLI